MNFDQLGQSWRDENEPAASAEQRLEQYVATTRAAERFTEKVVRRDLIETIACLFVIYMFGLSLLDREAIARAAMPTVFALGMVINIAGAVYVMYRMHRTRLSTPRPRIDAPVREYCENEIERVEKQIALLKSVHLWYLGPFYVGVTLVFLGSNGFCAEFWGAMTMLTLVYGVIYALNRAVATTSMAAIRDRLVWLRDQLDTDEGQATEPPDLIASEAATRRFGWRIFWGALALGLGGIALGWWFDAPDASDDKTIRYSEYSKRSPFDAIRWQDDEPEVRLDDEWFKLFGVEGVTTKELLTFCQQTYGDRLWRKRFEEDLVEVLSRMGHEPSGVARVLVSPIGTELDFVQKTVPMTEAKRRAIKQAAMQREKEGRVAD